MRVKKTEKIMFFAILAKIVIFSNFLVFFPLL